MTRGINRNIKVWQDISYIYYSLNYYKLYYSEKCLSFLLLYNSKQHNMKATTSFCFNILHLRSWIDQETLPNC